MIVLVGKGLAGREWIAAPRRFGNLVGMRQRIEAIFGTLKQGSAQPRTPHPGRLHLAQPAHQRARQAIPIAYDH
jgi:hypothetical protein